MQAWLYVFYEGGVVIFHAFAVNGAFLRVVGWVYVVKLYVVHLYVFYESGVLAFHALLKRADVFYESGVVVFHEFAVNGAFLLGWWWWWYGGCTSSGCTWLYVFDKGGVVAFHAFTVDAHAV